MKPASSRIPARLNVVLGGALLGLHLLVLLALPLLRLPTAWTAAALALVALLSPTLWALVHEAIHGLLLPQRRWNQIGGRVLAVAFGAPLRALRFAHLRHHRYNRTPWGRDEVYDPAEQPRWFAYAAHYVRITFGLYAAELAVLLACWLPRSLLLPPLRRACPDLPDGSAGMATMLERDLLSAQGVREMRVDSLGVLALYGTAFALYGGRAWLVVGFLAIRAFLASQFDHAPHHATPLEQRDHALNLTAPRWLHRALLNFPLHRTHHQNPNLPWTALPDASTFQPGDVSFVRGVLRQWRGPVAVGDAPRVDAASPVG